MVEHWIVAPVVAGSISVTFVQTRRRTTRAKDRARIHLGRGFLAHRAISQRRAATDAGVRVFTAALAIGAVSCAGAAASMGVKPPLQSQCQRLPIRGCGELVDGVLLYAEGEKARALGKIKDAKDQNEPAQLRAFAQALRSTAALPGAGDFAAPMIEVADALDSSATPATTAPVDARATGQAAVSPVAAAGAPAASEARPVEVQQDPATRALSATADFGRLTTETVELSQVRTRAPCTVALTLTGARLSVGSGERLQVAVVSGPKGPSNSLDCFVTWSGFRPWIVASAIE